MSDQLFEALGDRHRRQLLIELLNCDREETLPLSDAVSEDGTDQERVHIQLAHNHLPKLEEMEYVQWDQEDGEVARGPQFEAIEPSLELLVRHAEKLPDELV